MDTLSNEVPFSEKHSSLLRKLPELSASMFSLIEDTSKFSPDLGKKIERYNSFIKKENLINKKGFIDNKIMEELIRDLSYSSDFKLDNWLDIEKYKTKKIENAEKFIIANNLVQTLRSVFDKIVISDNNKILENGFFGELNEQSIIKNNNGIKTLRVNNKNEYDLLLENYTSKKIMQFGMKIKELNLLKNFYKNIPIDVSTVMLRSESSKIIKEQEAKIFQFFTGELSGDDLGVTNKDESEVFKKIRKTLIANGIYIKPEEYSIGKDYYSLELNNNKISNSDFKTNDGLIKILGFQENKNNNPIYNFQGNNFFIKTSGTYLNNKSDFFLKKKIKELGYNAEYENMFFYNGGGYISGKLKEDIDKKTFVKSLDLLVKNNLDSFFKNSNKIYATKDNSRQLNEEIDSFYKDYPALKLNFNFSKKPQIKVYGDFLNTPTNKEISMNVYGVTNFKYFIDNIGFEIPKNQLEKKLNEIKYIGNEIKYKNKNFSYILKDNPDYLYSLPKKELQYIISIQPDILIIYANKTASLDIINKTQSKEKGLSPNFRHTMFSDNVALMRNKLKNLIQSGDYIIFDTETTGLSSTFDSIIQFAFNEYKGGKEIERKNIYLTPYKTEIKKNAFAVHKIDFDNLPKDVSIGNGDFDGEKIAKMLFEKFNNKVIVAHNANFDIGMLTSFFRDFGMKELPSLKIVDTQQFFDKAGEKQLKMEVLHKKFVKNSKMKQTHKADDDVNMLYELLNTL